MQLLYFIFPAEVWRGSSDATFKLPENAADEVRPYFLLEYQVENKNIFWFKSMLTILTKSDADVLFRGANSKSKVGRFLEQKVKEEKEISKKLERVSSLHREG